jgi:hypothetical protein
MLKSQVPVVYGTPFTKAVTEYGKLPAIDGVPKIRPVAESNDKPEGSDPDNE